MVFYFFFFQSVFSNLADFVTGNNEVPQTDTHWFSESGIIDIFIMLGPGPKDVFRQYAALTGTTPLPPVSWLLALTAVKILLNRPRTRAPHTHSLSL